jgi:acyl-CoA thioester hydrolase
MKQIEHSTEMRVRYKETDQMGVAYYSNYLVWFEVARTELFRARGLVYKDLEVEDKIFLPVIESYCRYKVPLKYDDVFVVKTLFKKTGPLKLRFDYKIMKDGKTLTAGYTTHVFVNESGEFVSIPAKVERMFKE